MYNTTCPHLKKKSSSSFWQVRCCAHRTLRSCQKYEEDFFKFCGLLRKPKLYFISIPNGWPCNGTIRVGWSYHSPIVPPYYIEDCRIFTYQNATQIRMILLIPATLVAVVEKLSENNAQNRKQISSNLMIWFAVFYYREEISSINLFEIRS